MSLTFPDTDRALHHPGCLGCGVDNPQSLGVHLRAEGGRVLGHVQFDRYKEGAPGFVHGGAVATVLDDALGTIPMLLRQAAVTANLNVDFRAPILLGTSVDIEAWPVRQDGRKIYVAGELRDGDRLVAEATGLFLVVPLEHFKPGQEIVGRW